MEKKTIGRFISALRRASGMTQKELGERLYVSDKTVSRWERDECTPELSLIPAIADIFGVTADELIRGERSAPADAAEPDPGEEGRRQQRSDRQFRILLRRQMTTQRNTSLIAAGIAFLGLIGASIANIGFTRGVIGFCIAAAFLTGSVIFQLCTASGALLRAEEMDDDRYAEEIRAANSTVVRRSAGVIFLNIGVFAFVLPLAVFAAGGYTGLDGGAWLLSGAICAGIVLFLSYGLYTFRIRWILVGRGLLHLDEPEAERLRGNNRLLVKSTAVGLAVALVLCAGITVLNSIHPADYAEPVMFDTYEALTEYTTERAMQAISSDSGVSDVTAAVADLGVDIRAWRESISDAEGNRICVYYIVPGYIHSVEFTSEFAGLPAKVYTQDAVDQVRRTRDAIRAWLMLGIAADAVVCAAVYLRKSRRK